MTLTDRYEQHFGAFIDDTIEELQGIVKHAATQSRKELDVQRFIDFAQDVVNAHDARYETVTAQPAQVQERNTNRPETRSEAVQTYFSQPQERRTMIREYVCGLPHDTEFGPHTFIETIGGDYEGLPDEERVLLNKGFGQSMRPLKNDGRVESLGRMRYRRVESGMERNQEFMELDAEERLAKVYDVLEAGEQFQLKDVSQRLGLKHDRSMSVSLYHLVRDDEHIQELGDGIYRAT